MQVTTIGLDVHGDQGPAAAERSPVRSPLATAGAESCTRALCPERFAALLAALSQTRRCLNKVHSEHRHDQQHRDLGREQHADDDHGPIRAHAALPRANRGRISRALGQLEAGERAHR
jgi:hypothetical protein